MNEYSFGSDAFWSTVVEAVALAIPSLLFTLVLRFVFEAMSADATDEAAAFGIVVGGLAYVLAAGWTSVCSARLRWRSGSAITSLAVIGVWITAHVLLFTVGEDPSSFFYFWGFFLVPAAIGYVVGSLFAWRRPPPTIGPRVLGAESGADASADGVAAGSRRAMPRYAARRIEERTGYPMTDDAHLTGRAKRIRLGLMWAAIALYVVGIVWVWSRWGWPIALILALGLILPSARLRRRRRIRHALGRHREDGATLLDEGLEALESVNDAGEDARLASYLEQRRVEANGGEE